MRYDFGEFCFKSELESFDDWIFCYVISVSARVVVFSVSVVISRYADVKKLVAVIEPVKLGCSVMGH